MDFSEPSEATQLRRAIDEFIEREVEPLEREHDRFLGEDYERHVVDDDHYKVAEYCDVLATIRQKSAEAGFSGMGMPEEVGGGGDVLTRPSRRCPTPRRYRRCPRRPPAA